MARRFASSRRKERGEAARAEPQTGTRVRVLFGNHESTGVVVGKTITNRYNVRVEVLGADEPVTVSYSRDELGFDSNGSVPVEK